MQDTNPTDLSDDDLMAAAMGDEDDTEVELEGADDATPQADQDDQDDASDQQTQNWNPDGPGDLREAIRQEREQRRYLEQQMAAYQQQLAQYQLQQQYAQQSLQQQEPEPPNPWEDPAGYTKWEIQQALAPMQGQLQQATGYIQHLEYERDLHAFGAQHPGAPDVIRQIDAEIPELRGMPIEAKYYLWLGAQKTDPAAQQRAVEEQARKMAAGMASKQLTNKTQPPSLAHIGGSTSVAADPLPLHKLSDEDLRKRARGQ
jgi:hypothetical protein